MGEDSTVTSRRAAVGIAGAAGLIAGITLLARAAGLGRVLVFAESVRANGVGEIYQSVNALPNVLVEVAAGGVLSAIAVPLIAGHMGRGDRAAADRLASVLLTWVLAVLVPVAVLLALLAEPAARWLVSDFDPRAHAVAVAMLRVFTVQVPLYGLGIVLTGLLHAHRRFAAAALAPLLSSIVVMASYLWYGGLVEGQTAPSAVTDHAIAVLAWGTTAGVAMLSVPLLIPAIATGWRWRPAWRLSATEGRQIGRLAVAGILVVGGQQVATLVVLWLANHAGDRGVLPVWQYAQTVYLLPYAVLAVPIAMSTFPALALATGAQEPDVDRALARSLSAVLMVAGLGAGVLMATARPVGAFFTVLDARRGSAGASAQALAALPGTLWALGPGLVGFCAIALLLRAAYVKGSALASAAAVTAGWLIAASPVLFVGTDAGAEPTLRSLAQANSVGMILAAFGLAVLTRRAWGPRATAGAGAVVASVCVGVGAALAVGDSVGRGFPLNTITNTLLSGALSAVAGAAAYVLVMWFTQRDLTTQLIHRGRERRGQA